jgi:hypothetical protein
MSDVVRVGTMIFRRDRVDALVPVMSLPANGYSYGVLHLAGGGVVYLNKDTYAALFAELSPPDDSEPEATP